jgi:hypothetical protein
LLTSHFSLIRQVTWKRKKVLMDVGVRIEWWLQGLEDCTPQEPGVKNKLF